MSACSDRDRKKNEAADSSSSTTTTSSSRRDATLASLWTKLPDTSIRHEQISTAIAKVHCIGHEAIIRQCQSVIVVSSIF